MKKILNTLLNIAVEPIGAYLISLIGLFIYFFIFNSETLFFSLAVGAIYSIALMYPIGFIFMVIEKITLK